MRIKLACYSDTHGKPPRSNGTGYDAILHAGDAYGYRDNIDGLKAWRASLSCPLFTVRGNHDVTDPAGLFGTSDITGGVAQLPTQSGPAIYVVGIGWHGDNYAQLPYERLLGKVVGQALKRACEVIPETAQTVLLTHYPAATAEISGGSNPEGWIFDCVRQAIDCLRPVACVAGHLHEMLGKGYTHKATGCPILFPGPKGFALRIEDDDRIMVGEIEA